MRGFASILHEGIKHCAGDHFSIEICYSISFADILSWTILPGWVLAGTSRILAAILSDRDTGDVDGAIVWCREDEVGVARDVLNILVGRRIEAAVSTQGEEKQETSNLNYHDLVF